MRVSRNFTLPRAFRVGSKYLDRSLLETCGQLRFRVGEEDVSDADWTYYAQTSYSPNLLDHLVLYVLKFDP